MERLVPELLLRLLGRRDVEEVPLERRPQLLRRRRWRGPRRAPTRRARRVHEAVLDRERVAVVGALVRSEDTLPILGMEKTDEEVGVLLPRLGRVAEQGLDLRARVEVRADGVDRVDVDDERELLDERAVAELGRPQSLLAERAVAKVTDPRGEERRPVDREPPDGDLDRELLAVRALCGQLDPGVEDPARALGRPFGRPTGQAAAVRLALGGGTMSAASSLPSASSRV